MLKKAAKLLSEQGPKYDSLSSTRWWHSMEWWNGSIKQKSHNYNEIRKWFIIIETQGYTDREQWGYWVSPYKLSLLWLLLSSSLLSLLLVWSFVTIKRVVECQLFTTLLNHISFVEQSPRKYAGQIFLKVPYSIIIKPLVTFNATKWRCICTNDIWGICNSYD